MYIPTGVFYKKTSILNWFLSDTFKNVKTEPFHCKPWYPIY